MSALCHDKKVKELVLKECNAIGKKNGFKPLEILQAVILTPDEWTPESGLVTAAQKIQRHKISKAFEKEITVGCIFGFRYDKPDFSCDPNRKLTRVLHRKLDGHQLMSPFFYLFLFLPACQIGLSHFTSVFTTITSGGEYA